MRFNTLKNEGGYALMMLMVLTSMLPAAVAIHMKFVETQHSANIFYKSVGTKQQMLALKTILLTNSADPDSDTEYELWKEATGNVLPSQVTGNSVDEWGTELRYCTWDLGSLNTSDSTYSNNNTSPPKTDLAGKLISAGKDQTFQTACTDVDSSGDDIVLEIFTSDVTWIKNGNNIYYPAIGRVGIGTQTPQGRLHVKGDIYLSIDGSIGGTLITGDTTGASSQNQKINIVRNAVWNSTTGDWRYIAADEAELLTIRNGQFYFFGAPSGAAASAVSWNIPLFVDGPTQSVGVHTTSLDATLSVNGTATKPGGGVWGTMSDIRLKTNIGQIENPLGKLLGLKGVTYQWKEPHKHGDMAGTYMGFIAQDVENVLPEWVREEKGYKILEPIGYEALVVEALKELKAKQDREIKALRDEIEALKRANGNICLSCHTGSV